MTERNKFTPEQTRWLEALESGEYKQTFEVLRDKTGFCCLGVATHLIDADHPAIQRAYSGISVGHSLAPLAAEGDQDAPPDIVTARLYRGSNGSAIYRDGPAYMNDEGSSFKEIAAEIRKRPWWVFTNFDAPGKAST